MRALALGVTLMATAAMADERDTPWAVSASEAKGSYRGVKLWGESLYGAEHLLVKLDGSASGTLSWSNFFNGEDRGSAALKVEAIRIERGAFKARVVGKRPPGVPEVLVGQFVTRFPPENAKGPVRKGLRLEGGWFLELER
jgi:hypothetical protein